MLSQTIEVLMEYILWMPNSTLCNKTVIGRIMLMLLQQSMTHWASNQTPGGKNRLSKSFPPSLFIIQKSVQHKCGSQTCSG